MIIYLITCKINKKKYVGQTSKTLETRFKQHSGNSYTETPIDRAFKKYGKENFTVKKICSACSREELNSLEILYIKEFNTLHPNGYNIKIGGGCGEFTDTHKRNIKKGLQKSSWRKNKDSYDKWLKACTLGNKKAAKLNKNRSFRRVRKFLNAKLNVWLSKTILDTKSGRLFKSRGALSKHLGISREWANTLCSGNAPTNKRFRFLTRVEKTNKLIIRRILRLNKATKLLATQSRLIKKCSDII